MMYLSLFLCCRTKWKRQTAVGLELLAEAGNYAAFQRLYGGPTYGCWPYQGAGSTAQPSAADLYYRQAAVAAAAVSTLQKPLAYRLYPGVPATANASHSLSPPGLAATSLSSISSYYNNLNLPRSCSPEHAMGESRGSRTPDSQPESVDVEESSNDSPSNNKIDV